jgi:hypothetical protein
MWLLFVGCLVDTISFVRLFMEVFGDWVGFFYEAWYSCLNNCGDVDRQVLWNWICSSDCQIVILCILKEGPDLCVYCASVLHRSP